MHIGIIGAGVAGLSAAFDLTRQGHTVTIFEASANSGGLAAGFNTDGWDWPLEHFYHHWFASDDQAIRLVREIGLEDKLFFPRPVTATWSKGKAYQMDSNLSALLFPHLSLWGKFRFGMAGLYLKLTRNWQPMEQYTAHEWLSRWMGEEAYGKLWMPLLIGKWGSYWRQVNMAWFWARIYKRTPRLGYMEGGFQAFADRLAQLIGEQGGEIRLKTPINTITPQADGRLAVQTAAGEESFDRVIVTLSPELLLKMVPALQGEYRQKVSQLKSVGGLVLIASLKHQLMEKVYWLNLPARSEDKTQNEFPFLALVEHTNFISREHYAGEHIIYMGDYLQSDHAYFSKSKEELEQLFFPTLKKINPAFDMSWVNRTWLFKTGYAQPVPCLNQSQIIPPLKTPIPGLFWASMSQVYPWDRGTNYAIEIGRRAAQEAAL
jgi:protoporphyrinogen oxidase